MSFCPVKRIHRCAQCCLTSTREHFSTLHSGSKEQKLEEMLQILTGKGFSDYVDK